MKLVKSYLIVNEYDEKLGTITEMNNGNYHLKMYDGVIDFESTKEDIVSYVLDKMECDFSEVE